MPRRRDLAFDREEFSGERLERGDFADWDLRMAINQPLKLAGELQHKTPLEGRWRVTDAENATQVAW
jgi:hypothetical protein